MLINFKFFLGLIPLILVVLAGLNSVSTELTVSDIVVFDKIYGFKRNTQLLTFDQEIELIRKVQESVFNMAPLGAAIPEDEEREPVNLIRQGSGVCYDRSRTFDKAFAYLGFKTRHVYLLYRENRSFIFALFRYGQSSHAVTEVLTKKGWIVVDSNTQWISVTRGGEPVDADGLWQRFPEYSNPPEYIKKESWAIRGLYTRKGTHYSPYIYFPEIAWRDMINWLVF